MEKVYKPIPGFEKYGVDRSGVARRLRDGKLIRTYLYGDRYYYDFDENAETRLLAVHRAVALAWVVNDDPEVKIMVNHRDGNPLNNWYENLEWTTCSGNNNHAIETGLRSDNIPCRIRNFHTKEVLEFPSVARASEHMGLPKCTAIDNLRSRKFGKLIAGTYEFRLVGDPEPWFYEDKPEIISPSRYMVAVTDRNGIKRYFFNYKSLLKAYGLYKYVKRWTMPDVVARARELYPDMMFEIRDGYTEDVYRVHRTGKKSKITKIIAKSEIGEIEFPSMSKAARHFGIDRSVIKSRMNKPDFEWCGWTFNGEPYIRRKFNVKSRGIAGTSC